LQKQKNIAFIAPSTYQESYKKRRENLNAARRAMYKESKRKEEILMFKTTSLASCHAMA
jgi:hypothetical protein